MSTVPFRITLSACGVVTSKCTFDTWLGSTTNNLTQVLPLDNTSLYRVTHNFLRWARFAVRRCSCSHWPKPSTSYIGSQTEVPPTSSTRRGGGEEFTHDTSGSQTEPAAAADRPGASLSFRTSSHQGSSDQTASSHYCIGVLEIPSLSGCYTGGTARRPRATSAGKQPRAA